MGRRYKVSPSAVAIGWVLQQPSVAAATVGARNASHVRDLQVCVYVCVCACVCVCVGVGVGLGVDM